MRTLFALVIVLAPALAVADSTGSVDIELNDAGKQLAADLGFESDAFAASMGDKVREAMGLSPIGNFLRTFSNATSFSNRGLGVDYASNSERGILGVAANVAVATDFESEVPSVGAAANLTLMAGLNLRRWGYPQLTAYANTFWRSASNDNLRGSIASVGGHLQYKLFEPTKGWKRLVVQWGGIDFTSGLEIAHWSFGLHGNLATSVDVPDAAGTQMSTIGASTGGRFDLSSTTVTVPIEVTTNIRLLYVASLYIGLGIDAQVGSSKLDVGVDGMLTEMGEGGQQIGSIAVRGTASQGPSFAGYHALLGLQVNLWRLKIFAQGTIEPIDRFSFALGTRVVL